MRTLIPRSRGLAYLDSFSGLVPCRAISFWVTPLGQTMVEVIITSDRGVYKKGEVVGHSALWVVPRDRVRGRRGKSPRVLPFDWRNYSNA